MSSSIAPPALSRRRRWTVLAVCAAAMFLVGLDTTIVNVALPDMGRGLHVGTRELAWVVDAYTIVFAGLLITSGSFADRWGRRRVFQAGLLTFGTASLLCSIAPSLEHLIAARLLQGVGASMLSPVALGIVVNAMPDPAERAKAIGVWASVFGLSMAAGPVTGGALIAVLDWRAVFWINVPVVALAVVLVRVFVPESHGQRSGRLDPPGQALLITVIGLIVGMLIEGPHIGWASNRALVGYALLTVALIAFVTVERRSEHPLIDLALFRRTTFSGAVLAAVAVFISLTLTSLLLTFYLQNARGWSPLAAGASTLPMAVAATVCAPWSGVLVTRVGARRPILLAGGFLFVGGVCFSMLPGNFSILLLLVAYLLVGIGIGFANAPITNTAVSSLPPERASVAGGITSTARQVGAAIGIAVAGGLVATASPTQAAAAVQSGCILVATCGLVLIAVARVSPVTR